MQRDVFHAVHSMQCKPQVSPGLGASDQRLGRGRVRLDRAELPDRPPIGQPDTGAASRFWWRRRGEQPPPAPANRTSKCRCVARHASPTFPSLAFLAKFILEQTGSASSQPYGSFKALRLGQLTKVINRWFLHGQANLRSNSLKAGQYIEGLAASNKLDKVWKLRHKHMLACRGGGAEHGRRTGPGRQLFGGHLRSLPWHHHQRPI